MLWLIIDTKSIYKKMFILFDEMEMLFTVLIARKNVIVVLNNDIKSI